MLTFDEICYLAGFFDGEGYIGIHRYTPSKQWALNIVVAQKDKSVLEEFQTKTGYGKLLQDKTTKVWKWKIASRRAIKLINLMYPYLRVKKPQATVAKYMYEVLDAKDPEKYRKYKFFSDVIKLLNQGKIL